MNFLASAAFKSSKHMLHLLKYVLIFYQTNDTRGYKMGWLGKGSKRIYVETDDIHLGQNRPVDLDPQTLLCSFA